VLGTRDTIGFGEAATDQGKAAHQDRDTGKQNDRKDVAISTELLVLRIPEPTCSPLEPGSHAGETLFILESVRFEASLTGLALKALLREDVLVGAERHQA